MDLTEKQILEYGITKNGMGALLGFKSQKTLLDLIRYVRNIGYNEGWLAAHTLPPIAEPYLKESKIIVERKYNPDYGDERMCQCGHYYHRHFDTWADMDACGCKYCECEDFVEGEGKPGESLAKQIANRMPPA